MFKGAIIMVKKWIQKAISPSGKGALRKTMGAKKGKPLEMGELKSEAKNAKTKKTRKRANLAINLKK